MFIEPTNKEEFTQAMEQYYATINDATANGAIFCGVCRGKVSLLLPSTFLQITKVDLICLCLPYSVSVLIPSKEVLVIHLYHYQFLQLCSTNIKLNPINSYKE